MSVRNTPPVHHTQPLSPAEMPGHPLAGRQAAAPPPLRRRPRVRIGRLLLTLLVLALLSAAVVAVSGVMYVESSFRGKIYPNVSITGLDVGNLTPLEAEAALRARYGAFLKAPATISFGDQTWTPTPSELGISFNFKSAVQEAYRTGRTLDPMGNIQQVRDVWEYGSELPLTASFDEQVLQAYLLNIATTLERAPADATVRIVDGRVETTLAVEGRQILVNETLRELSAGLQTLTPQAVELKARALQPRILDDDVAAVKAQVEQYLQGPITLRQGEQEFSWSVRDLSLMLEIQRIPGDVRDQLAVQINQYLIDRRIYQIADATEQQGTYPRVAWNDGNLQITRAGDAGQRVDEIQSRELVLAAFNGGERTIELPMRSILPPVHEGNLHTLGINEVVSVGKSDFTGSADYRITNIIAGMRLLDGILIAPGEEFSFNSYIGSIDERNGFVKGAAIVENRTQLEFGGGICQDSTTVFRAVFWAGLPITERWGHSFYISWYDKFGPTGMDATIFTGGPDLKFVNDTGHWLLMNTYANARSGLAQVTLYGTKPDREVKLTQRVYDRRPAPPEPVYVADPEQPAGSIRQSDKARGGMTIDIYRIVVENGVERTPELFRTRFRPWPNIFVVNPADMGPDGRPILPQEPPADAPAPPPTDPNQTPPPPGTGG